MKTNISWLFYKNYFDGINWSDLKATTNVATLKEKNAKIIQSQLYKIDNPLALHTFEMQVEYPGLVTGVGINHEANLEGEFKLGLHFNYTYGMPVIYGSSVKGLLKSAFPNKNDKEDVRNDKSKYIGKLLRKELKLGEVEKLCDWIFEGKESGKPISIYGRDIFFDTVVIRSNKKERILESDSITPHKKQGMSYEESMLRNPIPITFMKIASGVTMEFRFDLKSCNIGNVEISADDKKRLFKAILLDFGIGAKTNVGYGQFSEI